MSSYFPLLSCFISPLFISFVSLFTAISHLSLFSITYWTILGQISLILFQATSLFQSLEICHDNSTITAKNNAKIYEHEQLYLFRYRQFPSCSLLQLLCSQQFSFYGLSLLQKTKFETHANDTYNFGAMYSENYSYPFKWGQKRQKGLK